jgi:hypothetical protein
MDPGDTVLDNREIASGERRPDNEAIAPEGREMPVRSGPHSHSNSIFVVRSRNDDEPTCG